MDEDECWFACTCATERDPGAVDGRMHRAQWRTIHGATSSMPMCVEPAW
jgi:hypothetical protein